MEISRNLRIEDKTVKLALRYLLSLLTILCSTTISSASIQEVQEGAVFERTCVFEGEVGFRTNFNAPKSTGKVFWSGSDGAKDAAAAFAKKTGGNTLEMTKTGKFLDAITTRKTYPFLKPAWNAASKRFAKGAGSSTDVFHSTNGVRLKSVWATKEYPQLMQQGTKVNFHSAP